MNVKVNYWKSDKVSPDALDEIIFDAMNRRQHRLSDLVQNAYYDEDSDNVTLSIPRRWLLSQFNNQDYDVDYELRHKGFAGVLNDVFGRETKAHSKQLSRDIVWNFMTFLNLNNSGSEYIDSHIWERLFHERE